MKLINLLWILGIAAVLVVVNLQLLLTVLTPPPFVYTNVPFPLKDSTYEKGETIVMSVARCSEERTSVSVVSVKEFYNPVTGVSIPLPPGSGIIPPGCSSTATAFASVFPPGMPKGTYVIRGVTTFRGSFKTVDVAWQTQSFQYEGE